MIVFWLVIGQFNQPVADSEMQELLIAASDFKNPLRDPLFCDCSDCRAKNRRVRGVSLVYRYDRQSECPAIREQISDA